VPRVFIGSSSGPRARDIVQKLEVKLRSWSKPRRWDGGDVFRLSTTTLESLEEQLRECDFAILVFTGDDVTAKRGNVALTPRDNVIFEAGLFMGRLDRKRTFIVSDCRDALGLPSDLLGFTFDELRQAKGQRLEDAIAPVAAKIRRSARTDRLLSRSMKREIGALYRMVNACSFPLYPDVQVEELAYVASRQRENFDRVEDVLQFLLEQFSDYVYPQLSPLQLRRLRVYFAYYLGDSVKLPLGDGVKLQKSDVTIQACGDVNLAGESFSGEFVIGLSNPEGFEEQTWRRGRAIPGYDDDAPLSNCARAFESGDGWYLHDLGARARLRGNYKTAEENSVYTVPIRWRADQGQASLGVLAVSSRDPEIEPSVKLRMEFLANVIGYIFALHAEVRLPPEPGVATPFVPPPRWVGVRIGRGQAGSTFRRRAIELRRSIARHFEREMIREGLHKWNSDRLEVHSTNAATISRQRSRAVAIRRSGRAAG
jgi:hypothetical protein